MAVMFLPVAAFRQGSGSFVSDTQYFYQVLPPVVPLIFAATLAAIWHAQRRAYIGFFVLAFCGLSLGLAIQILYVPRDTLLNAVLSNLAYCASAAGFVAGLVLRTGQRVNVWLLLAVLGAVNLSVVYFAYVDRNLSARIWTQNFGFGLLFVLTALQLRNRRALVIDRVLFWSVLVFGISFFLRTALTAGTTLLTADPAEFGRSLFWISLNFTLVLFAVVLGLAVLVAIAVDVIEDARRDGRIDALTQVLNRRGFELKAEALFAFGERPVSLVLCDIDHFKAINDTYGHLAGDRVLAAFARVLSEGARIGDVVGRYGGEEFVILLAGADKAQAQGMAERIRAGIAAAALGEGGTPMPVTASFGVAEHRPGETLEHLIRRADRRLYAAKRAGRNKVVAREPDTASRG